MQKISIDPITRLEGHGRIDIFLNDEGDVANAYLVIPELRGFEKFAEGRRVEEMNDITPRICGVCPEAHHMAATKACDAVYHVDPPPTAKKLRELFYSAFYVADHTIHFYILGAPDFVMGPDAPPAERNILGLIHKVGVETGTAVIQARGKAMDIIGTLGGRKVHPTFGVPGGVARRSPRRSARSFEKTAREEVDFALFSIQLFKDVVLKNQGYVDLILSDAFTMQTYYMGMVDANNKINFYDGKVRVVDPDGKEFVKYSPNEYLDVVAERVEPWTYLKFPYLKKVGLEGAGHRQGQRRLPGHAALAAQRLGRHGDPARAGGLRGVLRHPGRQAGAPHPGDPLGAAGRAALRGRAAAGAGTDPEITNPHVRNMPTEKPTEGVGIVEAPRGTLTHHYITDERGIVKKANLIVGTTNNYAPIAISVRKAAQAVIQKGVVTEGILNRVEMAFRSYDPCFGCATHTLSGQMPLEVRIFDAAGKLKDVLKRE